MLQECGLGEPGDIQQYSNTTMHGELKIRDAELKNNQRTKHYSIRVFSARIVVKCHPRHCGDTVAIVAHCLVHSSGRRSDGNVASSWWLKGGLVL